MVINKAWAAREIIRLGSGNGECESLSGILGAAQREMDDLIDWVKELRTVRNRSSTTRQEVACKR
jgi:hypothetical protein